jgi:putative transposase
MVDHVIKLLSIPPKYSISQMMGYINGKSATHIARTYGGRAELCWAALLGTGC